MIGGQARKGEDELGRLGMDPSSKGDKESKKGKKDRREQVAHPYGSVVLLAIGLTLSLLCPE